MLLHHLIDNCHTAHDKCTVDRDNGAEVGGIGCQENAPAFRGYAAFLPNPVRHAAEHQDGRQHTACQKYIGKDDSGCQYGLCAAGGSHDIPA